MLADLGLAVNSARQLLSPASSSAPVHGPKLHVAACRFL